MMEHVVPIVEAVFQRQIDLFVGAISIDAKSIEREVSELVAIGFLTFP